jgi:hypothetical protein
LPFAVGFFAFGHLCFFKRLKEKAANNKGKKTNGFLWQKQPIDYNLKIHYNLKNLFLS